MAAHYLACSWLQHLWTFRFLNIILCVDCNRHLAPQGSNKTLPYFSDKVSCTKRKHIHAGNQFFPILYGASTYLINLKNKGKIHKFTSVNFYIHGSVHCDSILITSNEMQQYAGVYLLQNYCTCFRCLLHPSSGVHQTVTAASGTGHSVRATTFRQRGLIRPRWSPDDGCDRHPKHVE